MSVDGIMLAAVRSDLKKTLMEGRIDKIYQPEKYLLTISIRQPGENMQLLTSIHPQHSRVHISKLNFENPEKPPDFCMLLRKYLTYGYIKEIKQPAFERILTIEIESNHNIYFLILEIMGRYSNVILTDENLKVLDAMKRINNNKSGVRQLYPGLNYQAPPGQDKINPCNLSRESFLEKLPQDSSKYCFRALLNNFRGIGPYMAKEIIFRAGFDFEKPFNDLTETAKDKIYDSFQQIFEKVAREEFKPSAGMDENENIKYTEAFPLTHFSEIEPEIFSDSGQLFDFYYRKDVKEKKLREIKKRLLNIVNKFLKKNEKQQKKYYQRWEESKNAEDFRKKGELIKANIYQLKRGMKKASLINYFNSDQEKIEIPLDPELSPVENASKYFKKYNKAKKSKKYIKRELGKLKHEEKYLKQVKASVQQANEKEEFNEIENELKEEKYIKQNKKKNKKSNKKNKPLPPLRFKSSQGYDVLVGRNNKQNDYLTKKMASRDDLWLHTKQIAGSHVVIRNHERKNIPEKTIQEAAILAAWHSQARMSENVPVDFTEIKNINKPKGARPGLVYYDNYETVFVTPDQQLVEKLKV